MTLPLAKSMIRWGTEFEHDLHFGYPLENVAVWREPIASERIVLPSGVEDAWTTGWDTVATFTLRWVPWGPTDGSSVAEPEASGWSEVQRFLDYAREAGVFRLLPDATSPELYADCYLVDPLDPGSPGVEQDGSLNLTLTVRSATDLSVTLRGMWMALEPENVAAWVAARSTIGLQTNRDFSVTELAANVGRWGHWLTDSQGVRKRVMLFEKNTTNLIENSDYETDAVGTFVNSGSGTRDGTYTQHGAWAYKVTTTDVGGSGPYWTKRNSTRMAASATNYYAISVWVYATGSAVGKQFRLSIEWYDAATGGSSTGVSNGPTLTLVAGWQRLTYTDAGPSGTVAATPTLYTPSAQGVFDIWVDIPQFELSGAGADLGIPTTPMPTTTTTVVRDGDGASLTPVPFKPGPSFWYIRWTELGALLDGSANWRIFGTYSNGNGPFMRMEKGPAIRRCRAFFQSSANNRVFADFDLASVAIGDVIEMFVLLSQGASSVDATITVAKNGVVQGSATNSTKTGTPVFTGDWMATNQMVINGVTPTSGETWFGLEAAKVGPRVVHGRVMTLELAREL